MKKTIVIVEDEANLRENYVVMLRKHGYDVIDFGDANSAEAYFARQLPDLVILDIILGDDHEGGFAICRSLRERSKSLPIVFLTALDSEYDRISGYRFGGWDYLTKDVSLPLIAARIDSMFRILGDINKDDTPTLDNNPIKLDTKSWTCQWRDQAVNLTVTEFSIIHTLCHANGRVCSHDSLMRGTRQKIVNENTVSTHIRRIRKKFRDIDPDFDAIQSVHSLGYKWAP